VLEAPTPGGVWGRIIEASLTPAKCNAERLRKVVKPAMRCGTGIANKCECTQVQ
jgi:hypothetical protein